MIDLNATAELAFDISIARNQAPQSVYKHLAGEVSEAQEANHNYQLVHYEFTAGTSSYEEDQRARSELAEELADIIICALSASVSSQIDIESAVKSKMIKNQQRAARLKHIEGGKGERI